MIRIVDAGFHSTVQDRGRFGFLRAGVPPAGPADPVAFRAALALAGCAEDEAAIEVVGTPFRFICDDARLVAVTGRDVHLTIHRRLPGWMSVLVRAGELVTVGGTARTQFAYVAVSGGIATAPVLGARATYPLAGLGSALRPGDRLPLGPARPSPVAAGRRVAPAEYAGVAYAIPGPHLDHFGPEALASLFDQAFTVAAAGDRQGKRLTGRPLPLTSDRELASCGVVTGAIQVPRSGQPIVLLADRQTTGGYPVIATVVDHDLGQIAQTAPGEAVRFRRADPELAVGLLRAERSLLAGLRGFA